jgi:hypothetical protein
MSTVSLPKLRTPGVVARELGVPISRVVYVLATRPHIRPTALAGHVRLFDLNAVAKIRHEINAIDARRARKEAPRG